MSIDPDILKKAFGRQFRDYVCMVGCQAEALGMSQADFAAAIAEPLVDIAFVALSIRHGDDRAADMIADIVKGSSLRTAKPEGRA